MAGFAPLYILANYNLHLNRVFVHKEVSVRKRILISLALSALAGVIYFILLGYVWAYSPQYNPITNWLFDNLVNSAWFRPLIYVHDVLLNIILSFPLALLIYTLRPKNYFVYLTISLLPSIAWTHGPWLTDSSLNSEWMYMLPGLIHEFLYVPIALIIICWFVRIRT